MKLSFSEQKILIYFQPGPDSVGIFAISHSCSGVAARACGLVSLEPTKVSLYSSFIIGLTVDNKLTEKLRKLNDLHLPKY